MRKQIRIMKEYSFIIRLLPAYSEITNIRKPPKNKAKKLSMCRLTVIIRNRTIITRTRTKTIPKKGEHRRHQGKCITRHIRRRVKKTAMDIGSRTMTGITPLTHGKLKKKHR